MKRLLLLTALLAIGCTNRPPTPSQPPPHTTAVVAVTDLKSLENKVTKTNQQLTDLSAQVTAVNAQIANYPVERAKDKAEILADVITRIQTATSPLATKLALSELEQKLAAADKRHEQLYAELQAQHGELNNRLTQVQGELQSVQAEMLQQMKTLAADITRREGMAQQAISNSNLALLALNEIADKKTGGVLGIGRKELLSDEMQVMISRRAAVAPAPARTEGIVIPTK